MTLAQVNNSQWYQNKNDLAEEIALLVILNKR